MEVIEAPAPPVAVAPVPGLFDPSPPNMPNHSLNGLQRAPGLLPVPQQAPLQASGLINVEESSSNRGHMSRDFVINLTNDTSFDSF
ncbi:hypothetical protein TKK_0015310 [Trichogramma kaykai]